MSKQRILIIDDSPTVLRALRQKLKEAGYDVTATTQTVGVARYLSKVDLVIIDYHMPGVSGTEVLESLRGAAAQIDNVVWFYLYTLNEDVAAQYQKLGFDGCFTGKGDDDALIAQVDAAFRLMRLRALSGGGRTSSDES